MNKNYINNNSENNSKDNQSIYNDPPWDPPISSEDITIKFEDGELHVYGPIDKINVIKKEVSQQLFKEIPPKTDFEEVVFEK